ncbi:GspH/FimT family pseudopilin [Marinobacter nauticus]|nr:GspH/FimT family pseudopilin [Marinobacter nauticus]
MRHPHRMPLKQSEGFTIMELLTTLAVVGILAGIAVPSFYTTQQSMRVTADTNKFYGLIHYARSAASKTQKSVTLCPEDGQWAKGVYTTFGDCSGTPGSLPDRRTLTFDDQVVVDAAWSADGLTFMPSGAVTSSLAISPIRIGGTSPSVASRQVTLTATGTAKIERLGVGS